MNDFKGKSPDVSEIYKSIDGINLPVQVYFPKEACNNNTTVVCIHGGGWIEGITDNSCWDGGWMANNAKYLAAHGFTAIVFSYRSLKLNPALTVPDLLEDCADAVKYIHKNFSCVNWDKTAYLGDSAGGYFATMLGLSADDEIRPKKVAAANPVLNILDSKWAYGFKECKNIEKYLPIKCIGRKASEFLLLHGTADTVVDIKYTKQMNDALKKAGHKCDFMPLSDEQHAFVLFDYKNPDEKVIKIMDALIDFFK